MDRVEGLTRGGRPAHGANALPSPYVSGDLYDLVLGAYTEDIAFYVEHARAADGPALELGCGTGRVLLPTIEAGVDIEGIEIAPAMLERLARSAAERGLAVRAARGDMRRFARPRRFALVTIPFNAFVHNLTPEDQIATLSCCREHLLPGGRLVFDVMYPNVGMLADDDGVPVLELEVPHPETGLPVQLWDTRTQDPVAQTQHSLIEIRELDAAGAAAARHHFETTLRWVHRAEMELLLRIAGFARWSLAGDFDGEPLTDDSVVMVVTAWRE
ncbi:MAG: class I SAM-dependent methyltransferase [Candidatus Eisenbacteria bacterium]|nr:class I SAM-dependent methyltransferase [Candidatus Eisenbacteria bacterium]